MKKFIAADLFCGAGGTSTGLIQACAERGINLELLAVNHWKTAVKTHALNHPFVRHLCADLNCVDPSKAVPGGRLDLLLASPECTHHSNARGGKPCSDQSRASVWHVVHWAERLWIDEIRIENVREFLNWGPLLKNGRPDPKKKGVLFESFVNQLKAMGYAVEWKVLNAADYGEATTRKRLFIAASKSGRVAWPESTHVGRWRPASDIIDWSLPSQSVLGRKRPLKPKTMARIEAGLRKFGGEAFIAVLRGTDESQAGSWSRSTNDPLGTITAGGGHQALCQPFVVQTSHTKSTGRSKHVRSIVEPMTTLTTRIEHGLVQPFLVEYHSPKSEGDQRVKSVAEPLPTATTENRFGLVQPFLMNVAHEGGERVSGTDQPLSTIPAGHRGEIGLVTPFVIPMEHHGGARIRGVSEPLPTITTAKGGAFGMVQPFLTKYYGTAGARPVDLPLDVVTTKDRYALVQPGQMDILFRMLQPHELAAAMGFDGYKFFGTKTDVVKQVGNAVSVRTARALCGVVLDMRGAA